MTGNGGGAFEGGGKGGTTGGGADPTVVARLGGIAAAGVAPSPDTPSGGGGNGTFGLSLNRPLSAPATGLAGIEAAGFNEIAEGGASGPKADAPGTRA